MLQPYKKPELNLHAYIYQARSIRGGGGAAGCTFRRRKHFLY